MMASASRVRVDGMEALQARLGGLAALRRTYIRPAMQAGVHLVHSRVPDYPPPARKPYPFVSDRQRRYVMAAIRSGEITVPYRRSGQLGRSITGRVEELGGQVVGIIGTNLRAAPWVIGERATEHGGPQARYHQGTWWTLEGVVRDAYPAVVDLFERRLAELMAR